MTHYPYRTLAFLSVVLLVPADIYFLASMTQAIAMQQTFLAHPQLILRLGAAFFPFFMLGACLHYLWLIGVLNHCEISIEEGWLKRTYRPLFPHFTVRVPIEDIQMLVIDRKVHHTRRGTSVHHSLKVQRRSGTSLTLLGGSAKPSLLKSVQSAIEKHLDTPGSWRIPVEADGH
jgi:hypothetical protein